MCECLLPPLKRHKKEEKTILKNEVFLQLQQQQSLLTDDVSV